jgi:hypothetical protein
MSIDVNIGSHSINMANGNFASLWAILDIDTQDGDGSINAGDLTARIMLAQVMGVQERPTVVMGNFINCGMDADYINHRFGAMLALLAQIDPGEVVTWW